MNHYHHQGTRRRFLRRLGIGSSLVLSLWEGFRDLLGAPNPASTSTYDLLIKGGRVIDPSQGIAAEQDVAISGDKIVRLVPRIGGSARCVVDARGKIVTPGLIDLHVHVYDGVAPLGIPADPNCIAKGVTAVVDAGSSGAHTFPGLRKYVIDVAATRVYALLNISVIGQSSLSADNPWGELLDLRYANPKLAIRTIEQNRDVILGIKIRMSNHIAGEHDLEALRLAREAADAVSLPIMVHIGGSHASLPEILGLLRKGDVLTHIFKAGPGGIVDDQGRVLPEVRKAVERGLHLDVGHGTGSFSWELAEKVVKQDVWPGTISSDLHHYNVHGPVFDLATTLSKFMHLGMSLEQVIACATANAANTLGFPLGLGTLKEGALADVAVFQIAEGDFEMYDAAAQVIPGITVEPGKTRIVHRKLVPVATVKSGRIYGSASIPVEDAYR
jgi:dihydroorotase